MDMKKFSPTTSKKEVYEEIKSFIDSHAFTVVETNVDKNWGGYFRLSDSDIKKFQELYYSDVDFSNLPPGINLSPKILFVAPDKRLSWQYHNRRREIWRIINGPVKIMASPTDEQPEPKIYQENDLITFERGIRHRMIGMDNWGVWAEIWYHTDPHNPSEEEDIVRVSDDFGREGTTSRN